VDRGDLAVHKKKARKKQGWIVFQDESGASQKPPLRRTWAPKGQTPVVVHSYKWDKLSISAVIAYRWDRKRSRVYFDIIPGSYDAVKLIQFFKGLKRHFRGEYVILVWDGLPAHRSGEMNAFLESQRDWLQVERLPGYAPDLNPVEGLWGNIKGQELANQSADNLGEVADAVKAGFERVKTYRQLTFGFLEETGLSF
jgi:hypothetical protein